MDSKKVLLLLLIISIITNSVLIILLLSKGKNQNEEDYYSACQEEINDFKLFVCDWYAELLSRGEKADVYKNEIRFRGGQYPLTVSENRLRAVFPRGERFFRLHYITYAEFYEENGRILCRMFYGNGGEFVFRVN